MPSRFPTIPGMANAKQAPSHWVVHKFGGTSLADADHYLRVSEILGQRGETHQAIVVSAMAGITNRLLHLVELASKNLPYQAELEELQQIQKQTTEVLADEDALADLQADIADISDILHSTSLVGHAGALIRDRISGYGELWSARQLAAFLNSQGVRARFLDARDFIVTTSCEMGPSVNWKRSQKGMRACWDNDLALSSTDPISVVIPGYISADVEGHATTLGRS